VLLSAALMVTVTSTVKRRWSETAGCIAGGGDLHTQMQYPVSSTRWAQDVHTAQNIVDTAQDLTECTIRLGYLL
jgi:hypothetical protein